ncbi:MAG: hypothetical protein HOP15_12365 [Planctomycetes bacterium]|nr:hypothetical protein [Planctomycetota bacterium]
MVFATFVSVLLFLSLPKQAGGPEDPALDAKVGFQAIDQLEQAVYSKKGIEYYLVHGEWSITTTGAVQRLVPSGADVHVLELGMRLQGGGHEARLVDVPQAGEVYIFSSAWIIIDFAGRDRVQLEASPRHSPPTTCDAVYAGVQVSFSGGCWGKIVANPETGLWVKPCDKNNSKQCKATVTFDNGAPTKNPEFDCSETGGGMTGNANTGSAIVTGAMDGTC